MVTLDQGETWSEHFRGAFAPNNTLPMTTDPDNKPTTEEQPTQAEVAPLDDFELPATRQEGTNCTDDICTVCQ